VTQRDDDQGPGQSNRAKLITVLVVVVVAVVSAVACLAAIGKLGQVMNFDPTKIP
jgi:hypothetical protein